jgi:ubiquitin-conjugating enzyme E2 W
MCLKIALLLKVRFHAVVFACLVSDIRCNVFGRSAESIYAGESFDLHFIIDSSFPARAPIVKFGTRVPAHAHVYSNGMICMEPLYSGWTAKSSTKALLLDVLVMLRNASMHDKIRPSTDGWFSSAYGREADPRQVQWLYHDEYEYSSE